MRPRTALLALALLGALHTWPLSLVPWRLSLNHNADAELNAWVVSWIPHALATDPWHLFDGNMFAPERATLAYSEPLLVPGLAGAPLRALGASPVLTFNVLTVLGLTLTAWSGWFAVWRWTRSASAGLIAGALVAFNVHLLTRLPHLAAAHLWGPPLAIYFAHRAASDRDRTGTIGLAVTVGLTAVTSAYSLALVGLAVVLTAIVHLSDWRALARLGTASLAGLVAALPILWPYIEQGRAGLTRPLEMVAQFSATPAGYLTSTSRLHAGWTHQFYRDDVNVFFAGVTALVLAVAGGASCLVARRWRVAMLLGLLAGWRCRVVVRPGDARSIARSMTGCHPCEACAPRHGSGSCTCVAVALAAGLGVAWLEQHVRSPRRRSVLAFVLLTLITAEVWQGPVRTTPFNGVPPIYDALKTTSPVRLAEVPFFPPEAVFENGEYMLNATRHWQPLLNGYSGFTPDSYRTNADPMWYYSGGARVRRDEGRRCDARDGAPRAVRARSADGRAGHCTPARSRAHRSGRRRAPPVQLLADR